MRLLLSFSFLILLSACGGGGSDSSTPTSNVVSTNINLSASKSYVGESATISWASNNANSCSASGDWTGDKATSGSETFTFDTSGDFVFEIVCSNTEFSDSASFLIPIFEYTQMIDEQSEITEITWDADADAVVFVGDSITDNYRYSESPNPPMGFDPIINLSLNFLSPNLPDTFSMPESQREQFGTIGIFDVEAYQPSHDFMIYRFNYDDYSSNTIGFEYNKDVEVDENGVYNIGGYDLTNWIFGGNTSDSFFHNRFLYTDGISQVLRPRYDRFEYTNATLVEIFSDRYFKILPTRFGDKTNIEDMPITETRETELNLFAYYFNSSAVELDDYRSYPEFSDGTANEYEEYLINEDDGILFTTGSTILNFNFIDSTIEGRVNTEALLFDKFKEYGHLKDSSLFMYNRWRFEDTVASMPDQVFEIRNGTITGNSFSADIMLNGSNEEHSAGFIKGNFYGPDASEVALEIIFYDIPPNQNCGYSDGSCNYKILVGSGIGAFETPSN
jgi:hypothetical protein